jgi:hypothetical protein
MKQFFSTICVAAIFLSLTSLRAEELEAFAGKWLAKKVNDQGEKYSQTIEIKKDKFVFEILGGDQQVLLHAEGGVKLEKAGPFFSMRFYHIRAGSSSSNLQEIDDDYVSAYVLDNDTWTLASNFDKQRADQKPSADVYRRVKASDPAKPPKSG